jgi:YfiR/HmsC-like
MKTVLATFCLSIVMIGAIHAQERPTHEIHAAMVYNFIKYVQWPDETEAGEFVVGVLGDDNVFNTLKQWYDGKPKGSKKYVVKKLASSADANSCHVVYLGKSKNKEFDVVKASTTGKSILTVTDGNGLGQKGSCINFKVIDGKLKFELNQGVVSGSNLKISSQLSSMAIII